MITSELIKLLQQEDPSGECHVRINGMMPRAVEKKDGYLDGPYEYMENGKLIFSTENQKVDIYTLDIENFVWDNFNDWENKVEIRYNYIKDEREKKLREKLSKIAQEARDHDRDSVQEISNFIINKIKEGYKVIQKDTGCDYHTMFFIKEDEEIQLKTEDCHAIISGSFRPIVKENHIEWESNA